MNIWEQFRVFRSIGIEVPSPCTQCEHFLGEWKGISVCKAFPKGIPPLVWAGRTAHDKVLPGQRGKYIFERR